MTNSHRTSDSQRNNGPQFARRRATIGAAVGIAAAAVALPVFAEPAATAVPRAGSVALARALSMQMDAAASSSSAALAQGVEQLNAKQYEEAAATLAAAKADELDEAGKAQLATATAEAAKGAAERKAARAAFGQGEAALAAGDSWGAITHFVAAKDNAYADAATVEKANTQATVAAANLGDLNAVYDGAKADYEAGKADAARQKFAVLAAIGFKPGMMSKSPADYVKLIDEKQGGAPAAIAEAAPAAAAEPAQLTPAQQQKAARDAYVRGRTAYHRGDVAGAKEYFQEAANLRYRKGFGEVGPEKMLQEIAKKEQADVARAARANRDEAVASISPVVVPPAPSAEAPAVDSSSPTPMNNTSVPETAVAQATPPAAETPSPAVPSSETPPATGDRVTAPAAPAAEAAAPTGSGLSQAAAADRVRQQQNVFRAKQFVDQADQAKAGSRYAEAASLYDEALKYDPTNTAAQAGKAEVQRMTGTSVVQTDILTGYEGQIEAKKKIIRFGVDAALEEARMATNENDFAGARRAIIKAQGAADSDPSIFPQEEVARFRAAINAQERATNDADAKYSAAKQAEDRQKALDQEAATIQAAEIQRRNTITALIRQSRQLTSQGRNEDALKVVNQILTIEPLNDYALGVKPLIWDKIQIKRQRDTHEKVTRSLIEVLNNAEEVRVPIPDLLQYPADWPDLSAQRDATTQRERGGATDAATEAILGRTLPSLPFDNVPFSDVIDYLRDTTQANIFVNWTAIEAAGVDKNQPITVKLTNVKFAKVLAIILDSAGGGVTRLGYTIDDGVITISTQEDLAKNVATRTYDIRDLLLVIPDYEAPTVTLSSGSSGGRGGGGGGQSLFSGAGNNNNQQNQQSREQLVEQITQLITDTIASDSWKVNGGLIGAVQELGGQLIVTQTPENQTAIARLLEQLRETRAIQVNVEARFLSVQRNFLEEVGVDFDFQFNVDYDNATSANPGFGPNSNFSPILVNQNSVGSGTTGFTGPASLITGVASNLGPEVSAGNYGLQTGVSAFLDDFRATLFLRAVQVGQNSTTLTAPKITLFNGQSAYIQVETQQSYISDLNPVVGTGAVGQDPQIDQISTGVQLAVTATVSSDRKYVTLTINPRLRRLIALRTFSFSTGDVVNVGGDGNSGVITTITNQVQLPEYETTELATTVSVPDRGTLLLGGQTLMGEIEREAGVPVLSKIPFLKRLFTNRGTAKDEQVLLILVKPTIIIQREVESSSFPLLDAK